MRLLTCAAACATMARMATSAPDEPTIGDIGEFGLIDQVTAQIGDNRHVLLGPGDDAAHVSTKDGSFLVSTDLLVEGRHFRRDWSSPHDIGRKAAACNLSDINAMGGVATALTVGFGAPADLPVSWALEMTRGFEAECAHVGAHIVGGDVTASDKIIIAVTAMGDVVRPVLRSGALPGDVVAYAGQLGLAGAGFAALSRGFRSPKAAVDAHRVPHPPYAAGPQAAGAGATSMTDISDGLLADLGHIADASGVAIDLDSSTFVIPEPVATVSEALGVDSLTFMLTGGDDYALVATFSSQATLPDGWTRIGIVSDGGGLTVDGKTYEGPAGHQHFR
jgi:thiamine-monophosphate kinase